MQQRKNESTKQKRYSPQCSCYLFNIRSQNSNPSRWVIGLLFWIKILYLPWLFTSGMATKVMQSRNILGIDILQSEFLPSIKASKCHRSFKIDLFTLNFQSSFDKLKYQWSILIPRFHPEACIGFGRIKRSILTALPLPDIRTQNELATFAGEAWKKYQQKMVLLNDIAFWLKWAKN